MNNNNSQNSDSSTQIPITEAFITIQSPPIGNTESTQSRLETLVARANEINSAARVLYLLMF